MLPVSERETTETMVIVASATLNIILEILLSLCSLGNAKDVKSLGNIWRCDR